LKKQIKPQKKAARTNTNTAKAVVNITNPPRRRYVNRKAFQSGLNDLNRVIVSSGNNNKNTDLINHLINRDKQNSIPAPEPPKSQNLLNYSEINRISGMLKDDRLPDIFQKNFPYKETKLLMQDYALEHLLRQNEPRQVNKQPSFANQNLQQDPKTYDYAPKSPSEQSLSSIDEPEGVDIGSYDLPTKGRNPDVLDRQNILKELQKQQEEQQRYKDEKLLQNEELEQEISRTHEEMINTPDDDDVQYGELQKKYDALKEKQTSLQTPQKPLVSSQPPGLEEPEASPLPNPTPDQVKLPKSVPIPKEEVWFKPYDTLDVDKTPLNVLKKTVKNLINKGDKISKVADGLNEERNKNKLSDLRQTIKIELKSVPDNEIIFLQKIRLFHKTTKSIKFSVHLKKRSWQNRTRRTL